MRANKSLIKLTAPIPPSVNSYLGKRVVYSGGRAFVQMYKTDAAKKFENYMKKVIIRAKEDFPMWCLYSKESYIEAEYTFYLPRKHMDVDNCFKLLNDVMVENELLVDDSILIPRVKEIFIDSFNPRVEVELLLSDKLGIFKNTEEYVTFIENNCETCKRFTRNCSLLKKSFENRITKEICELDGKKHCTKIK